MRITIINRADGSVEAHRAGCADIARSVKKDGILGDAAPWTAEWSSKAAVDEDYNADFYAEGDEGYDIRFLPCTKGLADS